MIHKSRLRQALDPAAEQRCVVCGCTEDSPCELEDGSPCSWSAPGLCSNPECIAAVADQKFGGRYVLVG